MAKERIYLTDLTLHTRDSTPTPNFSKVAQKGRMYSKLPDGYANSPKNEEKPAGTFRISFKLPEDLMERINRGEVEIMSPEGGLFVYPGKDMVETMEKMKKKNRNLSKHRGRTWHADDKDVK